MGRKFVIGIGVSRYDDPALNLLAVPSDVARVTAFFAKHPRVQHEHVLQVLEQSPTNEEIRKILSRWFKTQKPDDVVVVYLAAHGSVEGNTAYVQGRDSHREHLAGEAIDGKELGRIIGQAPPHNVLLIVDTCVAGRLGSAIQRAAEDIADELNTRQPHLAWAQTVLCSTFGRDPAYDGRFADAFLKVVSEERWTGTSNAWVSLDSLMTGLYHELRDLGIPQVAERKTWGPSAFELIPNPNFGTRPLSDFVSDHKLAAHFEPAARGVSVGETGWYFTGRKQELIQIAQWLNEPRSTGDNRGMLVVTGSPGCGKSALVSRVVVLSNRDLRDRVPKWQNLPANTLPPLGAIHVVIWCHNKTLDQVVAELGERIGVTAKTAQELLDAIGERRLTIVFDALDEAIERHARQIASQLLRPMALINGVKILLGTRPHPVGFTQVPNYATTSLLEHLGASSADCIVLDEAGNRIKDMRDNVVDRLMATSESARRTPYSNQPDLARAVAAKVVEAAGSSFLVAAVTAKALAASNDAIDPADSDLQLPTEAGSAMVAYIDRLPEPDIIHDVLRPLAWARGGGLPWGPFWAALANAMARVTQTAARRQVYDDHSVSQVLDRAGDLVVETIEGGEPVYRLFHEALAEHLRSETDPAKSHAAIATTIMETGVRQPFDNVHPYALAHLAYHLAGAPALKDRFYALVSNPAWERAKRRRFGNSVGYLSDVDYYINVALQSRPRDVVGLVGTSVVYSRMMFTASPEIIELLARAGQLPRAKLMADNITFAIDRCLAFCKLAPIFAAEREVDSAQRCLSEAQRAIVAIDQTHSSMAWYWVTTAATACGFAKLAETASHNAFDATTTLRKQPEWETTNVLFWAAKAVGFVNDYERLKEIQDIFRKYFDKDWRNQSLQTASALGDREWLGKTLQAYLKGSRVPNWRMLT